MSSPIHSLFATACAAIALTHFALWHSAKAEAPQDITLSFKAQVGEQPFTCGESYQLGTPATMVTPTDFRFYVSNVALLNEAGQAVPLTLQQDGQWQFQNVVLLDFENKAAACSNGTQDTNTQIVGQVPPGNYKGLQFTLGIPFELNHTDATLANLPLNLTSLWWNWQGGYKFLRVDFLVPTPMGMMRHHSPAQNSGHAHQGAPGFAIHLGSTGCQAQATNSPPTACNAPNLPTVTFSEFDPAQQTIAADLAALVVNANLATNQPNTPPGCMSSPNDTDCTGIMAALGLPFGETPAQPQTFLTVDD